jgi:hypothetical protein
MSITVVDRIAAGSTSHSAALEPGDTVVLVVRADTSESPEEHSFHLEQGGQSVSITWGTKPTGWDSYVGASFNGVIEWDGECNESVIYDDNYVVVDKVNGFAAGTYDIVFDLPALRGRVEWGIILRGVEEGAGMGIFRYYQNTDAEINYSGSSQVYNGFPYTLPLSANGFVFTIFGTTNTVKGSFSETQPEAYGAHRLSCVGDPQCDGLSERISMFFETGAATTAGITFPEFTVAPRLPTIATGYNTNFLVLYEDPDYDPGKTTTHEEDKPPVSIGIGGPGTGGTFPNDPGDGDDRADRLLLVLASAHAREGAGNEISSITYDGQDLTRAGRKIDDTGEMFVEAWYLLEPAKGSHNVIFTFNGIVESWVVGAIVVYNIDQSVPVHGWTSGAGTDDEHELAYTIDEFHKIYDVIAGHGSASVTISGQDFGKALVHDQLVGALLTTGDSVKFKTEIEKVVPESVLLRHVLDQWWGPERADGSRTLTLARL